VADQEAVCSACSSTNLVDEMINHLFQCKLPTRCKAVQDQILDLRPKFIEWGTSTQLAEAMYVRAWAWIRGDPIPSSETLETSDDEEGCLILQAFPYSAIRWCPSAKTLNRRKELFKCGASSTPHNSYRKQEIQWTTSYDYDVSDNKLSVK
jgi:hypothetical protein